MTHVLAHRIRRYLSPPGGDGRVRLRDQAAQPEASELAARLRELTLRAHRTVQPPMNAADVSHHSDLRELRAAILRLEADLRAQGLKSLVTYVRALRHRVENQLV